MSSWTTLCLVSLLVILLPVTLANKYWYAVWDDGSVDVFHTKLAKHIPTYSVARATYKNEINQTGWAFLEIHTEKAYSSEQQAFSAGYIEGYLTHEIIWMQWVNTMKGFCDDKAEICRLVNNFVHENELYMAKMVASHPADPYWYQIFLYYAQINGLADGYIAATNDVNRQLSRLDIIWMNMMGDLDDLVTALTGAEPAATSLFGFGDHCSGLVKLLADGSDLYTSHVTWNSYQSMLRIQKKYVMPLQISPEINKVIPGHQMSFSSYPGFVQSTDDFYTISTGLVAAETTIGNSNKSLFSLVKPHGQIMEYARVMLANRLATSGQEWVALFKKHNSGTYNNQWYVVDYKRFSRATADRGATLEPGLLWVAEQIPGYVRAEDMTHHLKRTTFWPSFNLPFYPDVFNRSGAAERAARWGDWWTYERNPRGRMFRYKHAGIRNMADMLDVMRYNDYRHEPLSRCAECLPHRNAANAISARNDLNPANGTYPFPALGHRSHGGTDVKITNSDLVRSLQFLSVCGPTHNASRGVPPFRWSKTDFNLSHVGHPDLWVFEPLVHRWEWGK